MLVIKVFTLLILALRCRCDFDIGDDCTCSDVRKLGEWITQIKQTLLPSSCSDLKTNQGVDTSGIYTIYPYNDYNSTALQVFCDMATDNGGWLVFQRRLDGSENFFRNFSDYVNGFGKLSGEFWLGLDTLHELTKTGVYEIRADMEDFENDTRYAYHDNFAVGAGMTYTISTGSYSGTAGGGLPRNTPFSAKDFDQDTWPGSCSQVYKGGWWYASCHSVNPNGLYLGGPSSYGMGINWNGFRGFRYSLKRVELKIRKIY